MQKGEAHKCNYNYLYSARCLPTCVLPPDAAVVVELVSMASSSSLLPGPLSPGNRGGMVLVAWFRDSLLSFRIKQALSVALQGMCGKMSTLRVRVRVWVTYLCTCVMTSSLCFFCLSMITRSVSLAWRRGMGHLNSLSKAGLFQHNFLGGVILFE